MLSGVGFTRMRIIVLAAAAMLLSVLALGAIAASEASASPAICSQYPDLPQCQPDATDPGTAAPAAGPSADVASDNLPFTGYPLTALILLLLVLLLVGLAIRGYLAIRERTRRQPRRRSVGAGALEPVTSNRRQPAAGSRLPRVPDCTSLGRSASPGHPARGCETGV